MVSRLTYDCWQAVWCSTGPGASVKVGCVQYAQSSVRQRITASSPVSVQRANAIVDAPIFRTCINVLRNRMTLRVFFEDYRWVKFPSGQDVPGFLAISRCWLPTWSAPGESRATFASHCHFRERKVCSIHSLRALRLSKALVQPRLPPADWLCVLRRRGLNHLGTHEPHTSRGAFLLKEESAFEDPASPALLPQTAELCARTLHSPLR